MKTAIKSLEEKLTIDNVRENIVGIDMQVPTLDGSMHTYINLDNAASTPTLRPVFDKVNEFMQWYSSIHRGTGFKSQVSSHAYEEAHDIALRFVNADPAENTVIFGKNATESLNKLARRIEFKPTDVVLTTYMEHHSNDLPWRAVANVKHIQVDERGALDLEHLATLPDDELVAQLTDVKGVGVWTAHMFMIFELRRPDVLAVGDLGVRRAAERAYGLADLPSAEELAAIAEPWRPHRSAGCLLLWHSLANAPG